MRYAPNYIGMTWRFSLTTLVAATQELLSVLAKNMANAHGLHSNRGPVLGRRLAA